MSQPTDVSKFVEDLDGGVFSERLAKVLSHAAACATNQPKAKSNVELKMEIRNIGKGSQVAVIHTLKFKVPTDHGDQQETHTTETVMYVNQGGEMTLDPKDQLDMIGHPHRQANQEEDNTQ